jgi:predicted aspartyl protease
MLDDEEATLQQLNELCGSENLFSYTRVPRRRVPVEVMPTTSEQTHDTTIGNSGIDRGESVKLKILSHFIKGKISLTPMETVMMIPGELEHLESLVKVARKKKDAETANTQVSMVSAIPTLRRLSVNKAHRSKTLHLPIEVNHYLVEGLVDTGASMSVMAASIVRELGLMHLVSGSETYKTASGAVTQALGRIEEVPIKIGEVQCNMTFMVVDTDSYDILLGLDLLIKIGAIVDIEQGLIQVRRGPGANVEILPLTVVNLVQRSDSSTDGYDGGGIQEHMPGNPDEGEKVMLEIDSDSDSSESSDERTLLVDSDEGMSEFVDAEFEDLVSKEGSLQILQLTIQNETDNLLREEITDGG